jgi:hypothetical protein
VPRIGYSEEYGGNTGADRFPKIKLEANQRLRIVCAEQPWMEWVHRLEAPKLENGQPIMKRQERRGEAQLVYDMEWFGSPICTGDSETLKEKGADPANCLVCEASRRVEGIGGPVRRYAMNVVEYATRPDLTLTDPFNARIQVWSFTAKIYDKLLGFQKEWTNLAHHDLKLGPPEVPVYFQRFPIEIAQEAAWMSTPYNRQYMDTLWRSPGNRATDEQLRDACGRNYAPNYLREDVSRCEQRWGMARNTGPQPGAGWGGQQPQQTLQQGFGDLLGQPPGRAPAPQQPPQQPPQQAPQGWGQPQPGVQPAPAAGYGVPQQPMHPLEAQAAARAAVAAEQQGFGQPDPFAPQGQALQQAAAPDLAAMQAQQAQQMQQAGWGGAPPQQGAPVAGFAPVDPFGGQPQPAPQAQPPAPQQFPPPQPQGFGPGFGAPPQAQPPAQPGLVDPFGAQAPPPAQPGAGNGLAEFAPQTTMNPAAQAANPYGAPQQFLPPQQGSPGQAPPPAAPAPGQAVGFDELFRQSGPQQSQ